MTERNLFNEMMAGIAKMGEERDREAQRKVGEIRYEFQTEVLEDGRLWVRGKLTSEDQWGEWEQIYKSEEK